MSEKINDFYEYKDDVLKSITKYHSLTQKLPHLTVDDITQAALIGLWEGVRNPPTSKIRNKLAYYIRCAISGIHKMVSKEYKDYQINNFFVSFNEEEHTKETAYPNSLYENSIFYSNDYVEDVYDSELLANVYRAIEKLSVKQQKILEMLLGVNCPMYTITEVADKLKISKQAVLSRYNAAVKQLRSEIIEMEISDD